VGSRINQASITGITGSRLSQELGRDDNGVFLFAKPSPRETLDRLVARTEARAARRA
jgi:hypothetical protein